MNAMHLSREGQATPKKIHDGSDNIFPDGEFISKNGRKVVFDISICSDPAEMRQRYEAKIAKYEQAYKDPARGQPPQILPIILSLNGTVYPRSLAELEKAAPELNENTIAPLILIPLIKARTQALERFQ